MKMRVVFQLWAAVLLLFAGSAMAASFQGKWSTNQGTMLIYQNGDRATGTYGVSGSFEGTVSGNTLSGSYRWTTKNGNFELTLSNDGKSFTGRWFRSSAKGAWTGKKIGDIGDSKPSGGSPSPASQRTLGAGSYKALCDACGEEIVSLGSHRFCALTGVSSGGTGSGCYVQPDGNGWILIAIDGGSQANGQAQHCHAMCTD
ncbi:MAG: hypothetical protein AB7E72_16390 [Lysobacterales bacterium]